MNTRHSVVWAILRPPVRLFLKLKFGYTCTVAKDLPENYIVLSNHVTDYDPLLVGASFPRQMYFVASEHIGRWGLASKLLDFGFAPILRKKGMNAAAAIVDVLRKLRKGANVCMFAEGVRTWDGVTCPITETTGQLVKRAGCAMVTYKIKGGYFLSPGWCSGTRRGWCHGAVKAVYTKEQLAAMSVDEVNEIIRRDLHEDAYARQLADPKPYRGRALAESFENLLYICPKCGAYDTIRTAGSRITCTACDLSAALDEFGRLSGMPHETVRELAAWQREQTAKAAAAAGTVYSVPEATLRCVGEDGTREVASGVLALSREAFSCGDFRVPTASLSGLALHGRRSLVFAVDRDYYELYIPEGRSILKFVELYSQISKEE